MTFSKVPALGLREQSQLSKPKNMATLLKIWVVIIAHTGLAIAIFIHIKRSRLPDWR
jgi:hypothetical protein